MPGARANPDRAGARLATLLPVLGLLLCTLWFLSGAQPVVHARHAFFDQLQRWQPRPALSPPAVTVVDIDDDSLARLGQWPWPRSRMAALTERLQGAGALAIGFDMIFSEADRSSPRAALDLWPLQADLRKSIAALPDHDERFARALDGGRTVLGYALRDSATQGSPLPPKFGVNVRGTLDPSTLLGFSGRLASLPALEQAAAGLGHVSVIEDSDGVVRKVPAMVSINGQPAPSMALETLRVASAIHSYLLDAAPTGDGIGAISIGSRRLGTDDRGEVWIHYGRFQPEAYVPAWRLMSDADPELAEAFRERIVLVGSSASLLHDMRVTPLGEFVPGVEIHRQFIEQALAGENLRRPGWMLALESLALVLGGLLAIALSMRRRSPVAALSLGLMVAALGFTAWGLFTRQGLLFDALSPGLAWLTCFVLGSLARLYRSELRQRWIRNAFSRYVSPNLVRHLITHPEALELGGRRQQCSFVFTDLEGFTSLIEQTAPREAVTLINEYLDGMIAIVFRHEGTLIRIVGDALAVMFSAPVTQPDHAQRALDCALALDDFARSFADRRTAGGKPFCRTRIGVHSGEVTVGNFGGSAMLDYRALGDPINVAARLEAANKVLGSRICVSSATLAGCARATVRPVGRLLLRGKREPVEVSEPVESQDAAYQAAFDRLRAQAPDAIDAFASLAADRPQDALVAFQLVRLRRGDAGDTIDLR